MARFRFEYFTEAVKLRELMVERFEYFIVGPSSEI